MKSRLVLQILGLVLGCILISATVVVFHDWWIVHTIAVTLARAERAERVERRALSMWRREYYDVQEREPRRWQQLDGIWVRARINPTTPEQDEAAWHAQHDAYVQRAEEIEP
jgi:hypothetical protein